MILHSIRCNRFSITISHNSICLIRDTPLYQRISLCVLIIVIEKSVNNTYFPFLRIIPVYIFVGTYLFVTTSRFQIYVDSDRSLSIIEVDSGFTYN